MVKVRRQPQRLLKKTSKIKTRNIFQNESSQKYSRLIPAQIMTRLRENPQIPIDCLQDLIPSPTSQKEINLEQMRKAFQQQSTQVPQNNFITIMPSISHSSPVRQETKKTTVNFQYSDGLLADDENENEDNHPHNDDRMFQYLNQTPIEKKLNCPEFLELEWNYCTPKLDDENEGLQL